MENTIPRAELRRLFRYYQREFRCKDWEIELCLLSEKSMENRVGSVTVFAEERRATIRIVDPEDSEVWNDLNIISGPEETLIHEFQHLVFWFIMPRKKRDANHIVIEQALNTNAHLIRKLRVAADE